MRDGMGIEVDFKYKLKKKGYRTFVTTCFNES
jgi:hypothetical protein